MSRAIATIGIVTAKWQERLVLRAISPGLRACRDTWHPGDCPPCLEIDLIRDGVRAGVSIDGAAVKGIKALPFSEIRATFPVLKNPANFHRAVPITAAEFHYAFTNTLAEPESKKAY